MLENPGLGSGIGAECLVAIEMVRSQVQQNGNIRSERFDQLELKAAQFRNRDGAFVTLPNRCNQWRPDVPCERARKLRVTQNVMNKRSRRGLAVRTRDADQLAVQEPECQFDFAPDRDLDLARPDQ